MKDYFYFQKLPEGYYKTCESVKYSGQFASTKLTGEILEKRMSAQDDPRWQEFGFAKPKDYEFWSWRACAIICLKMIIDSINNDDEKVETLIKRGTELGGYVSHDKNGRLIDKGWYYKPLINLAREYGLDGKLFSYLSIQDICREISNKHFMIASVDPDVIRYDKKESDGLGGHLVLIYGFKW